MSEVYVVVRKPVFDHDEGKWRMVGVAHTREEAEALVAKRCNKFFTAQDYVIAVGEVEECPSKTHTPT